jgi:hypothetical protein
MTAENKPAYRFPVDACNGMGPDLITHENYDPIGIFLPPLGQRIVIFLYNL